MAKVRGRRSAASYISDDPVKKARSLANLRQFRGKKAIQSESREGKPGPFSSIYKNDITRFLEDHYRIPESKAPIILESFQKKDILGPLFYVEKRPTMALVGQTKKSGKSTLAAMIASWFLFQGENYSEVYLAARDKDQASWVVFSKLVKAIRMNPQILAKCKVTSDSVELPHKESVLRCLPTDISASGLNPNLVVFDELWSYEYESMTRFFEELTTVPTRKHPLILIVTYAGFDEDSLLFELFKKGLERKDPTFFFYWDHENRMPWQTKEYLQQQRDRLRANTYLRLHENRWTSSEESFIDMRDWDLCADPGHNPALPNKNIPIVVGVDVGISHDCSAVVALTRSEDRIKLICHRAWQPSKRKKIDLEASVESYIKGLARDYTLREVRYDPFQFHRSAMTLEKGGIKMVEFPQTSDRLVSMSQNLYDLVSGHNLVLYRDREMRQHAQKATAKESTRGWRIIKKRASHKIDLIIALAMAALGATELKAGRKGKVYFVGGD